jgi:hypothetical protein
LIVENAVVLALQPTLIDTSLADATTEIEIADVVLAHLHRASTDTSQVKMVALQQVSP